MVMASVITISSVTRGSGIQGGTPLAGFLGEEFFRRFFGELPERIPQRSLGSGVIVDPKGIALTNAHVVERATDIEVITLDGGKHRSEEHTSELQSQSNLVCRLLLEKKKKLDCQSRNL